MRVIRLRILQERHGRSVEHVFLIRDNGAGELDIREERRPVVDGDRSVCVSFDGGDLLLAVELA